jgi:hypothetical protein
VQYKCRGSKKEVILLNGQRKGNEIAFKDKSLRETDDITLLRTAYEELLIAYQYEIKNRIQLEVKLEDFIEKVNV